MKKALFRRSRSISIQLIVFLVLIITILPMNLLYINAARHSAQALTSQAESTISGLLSITVNEIDQKIDRAVTYMNDIQENNSYFLTMKNASSKEEYTINKFFLVQDLLDNCTYADGSDVFFVVSKTWDDTLIARPNGLVHYISYDALESFIADYTEGGTSCSWHLVYIDDDPYLFSCRYSHKIYFGSLIRLSMVNDYLPGNLGYASLQVECTDHIAASGNTSRELTVYSTEMDACPDFYIRCSVLRSDIIKELSPLQRYSYAFAIGYLILIPILMIILTLLLIAPLRTLLQAIVAIDGGNTDYRIGRKRVASEYRRINEAFDKMLNNLHALRIANYEKELERQQAEMEKQQVLMEKQDVELKNLQLMIRPHFLQNTFGLLYTLSQMEEYEKLGDFILYLSGYFRFIYRSDNLIPFNIELDLIRGYVSLTEVQFPNSLEITYDIPEKTEDVFVPPLLIHNFIENIRSHASRKGDYLHVLLRLVKREDGFAEFTIEDDGIGIPEGILSEINQGHPIRDKERTHIGVYNSWRRLEQIYGGRASLHFESELFEGTRVTVIIPMEVENDTADRK